MKTRNASFGADTPISSGSEFGSLNEVDQQVLEYGADMAAAVCNMVSASDDYEPPAGEFLQSITSMAAATLTARATLEAGATVAAAIDRNTAVLAALARQLPASPVHPVAHHAAAHAASDAPAD
ncbi:hypothetical protein N5J23_08125 [Comamonas aquatica]|uniref:Uncharacterized protein n=1 Tax=Comamonas aquatica TaxID=225991 RepID=A0AA42W1F3_9BURK|nr:hypothetical protein [Comamonas aquatica]MDH0362527.1 hypothetical protein [Comamonas aquatica]MDH1427030.1 hypothetical protein [Comamonas aquatica]MDH1605597.1 hypothetical protein [Comamonas aquatica]MDH1617543.1 hypothetical protein [Comamonas aquatica]MDH2005511.1 hypothetical protein [Comamonas aquatica]